VGSLALLLGGQAHSDLLSSAISLVFLGYLLYRQRQVRRVPRQVRFRAPALFLVIGLFTFVGFLQHNTVGKLAWSLLILSFLVGAGLGVYRAYTVKLWFKDRMLWRQGTWTTVSLWILATVLHVLAGIVIGVTGGPAGTEAATGMLYLAMSQMVQQVTVVHRGQQKRELARAAR
jgi:hypothetical protein